MNRNLKLASSLMTAVTIGLASSAAYAQEAEGEVGMALPGQAAGGQRAAAAQGASDHDAVVGRLGIGYLGRRDMLIGTVPTSGASDTVSAPVIGVRYWIDQMIGLDAGLGFSYTAGSDEDTPSPPGVNTDLAGITAFIFHAGVPLSLASAQHFSFQLVPELNVGFATQTVKGTAPPGAPVPPDLENKGFHLDLGVRGGAEIHFGFIDIPQLSLQGSVGVLFSTDSYSSTLKSTPEDAFDVSRTAIRTTVGDNPWNIFTSNVAAMYYF
jgi:hypothetical protein